MNETTLPADSTTQLPTPGPAIVPPQDDAAWYIATALIAALIVIVSLAVMAKRRFGKPVPRPYYHGDRLKRGRYPASACR